MKASKFQKCKCGSESWKVKHLIGECSICEHFPKICDKNECNFEEMCDCTDYNDDQCACDTDSVDVCEAGDCQNAGCVLIQCTECGDLRNFEYAWCE